jgi:hypothetical protein
LKGSQIAFQIRANFGRKLSEGAATFALKSFRRLKDCGAKARGQNLEKGKKRCMRCKATVKDFFDKK